MHAGSTLDTDITSHKLANNTLGILTTKYPINKSHQNPASNTHPQWTEATTPRIRIGWKNSEYKCPKVGLAVIKTMASLNL
jgi:hypothetical protein